MSPATETSGLPAPARIGIGGPVGSGKTALIERLIPALQGARDWSVAVVTNDLVTREDAERLRRSGLAGAGTSARRGDRRLPPHGHPPRTRP